MTIDTISIICCIAVCLSAILAILANPYFRKVDDDTPDADHYGDDHNGVTDGDTPLPQISVVVIAHNNAKALDAHLPIILTQDYAPGFEVIVVGEQGDTPTEGVITQYSQCKNLYATHIPERSLFMSKAKLAVALGVKAAHNEWIVLVDAESKPISDVWLMSLAKRMEKDKNLVIGYSNYEGDAPAFWRFHRLLNDCYLLRKAQRGTAFRSNGTNIAFRRSEFIAGDGYRGSLQYVGGEYDFIINKYARPYSTATATDADAMVKESEPTQKAWRERNVFYRHIRCCLERASSLHWLYNTDAAILYANYAITIAAATYAGLTQRWIPLGAAVLCLIATIVIRCIMASKMLERFDEDIPTWKIPFYELGMAGSAIANRLRYAKADKRDFTTHKL